MAKFTTFHGVATAIAVACVSYQTLVIWESVSGVSTTVKAGIPIATIVAAIGPVLAEAAWRQGERMKGLLFSLPVLLLLVYVLPNGVSRLGEAQQAKLETAATQQGERAKAEADLVKSKQLVAEAQSWVAGQCSTGNGPKCKGVTFILEQRQAHQRELTAKVGTMTAPPTPWLPAWHPATLPIGLELAAWVSLFFGLGPLTHARKQVAAVQAITEREEPLTSDELEELRRILLSVRRPVNNNELAALANISPGECSKRVRDAVQAGILQKQRAGREVAITLH